MRHVESARELLDGSEEPEEPTKPEEPPYHRPDPPTRPERPSGDESVLVLLTSDSGVLSRTYRPGVHPVIVGELPALIINDYPKVTVALCNPFSGAGRAQGVATISVDGMSAVGGEYSLSGGRIAPFFFQLEDDANTWGTEPGPHAQQAARKPLLKDRHAGFGTWNDVEHYCWNSVKSKPMDANQPGGWGVYPFIGYWEDWPEGRALSHRMMRGWAPRMSIFRYKEDAWREGRLELDAKEHPGYYGGCGTDQLPGYSWIKGDVDANDLDHEHFGRARHLAHRWAMRGDPFAQLIEDAMATDVWHRWRKGTFQPDQMNRAFAHSLMTATGRAKRTGAYSHRLLVSRLVYLAGEHQRPDGHVYFIPKGTGKWTKKIRAKKDVLGFETREGETLGQAAARCLAHFQAQPDAGIVIAFEAQLVLYALWDAEHFLGVSEADSVWKPLADALGPYPPEVIFPDNPALETDHLQGWGHLLPPFSMRGGVNLEAKAQNNPIGDGPCGSATEPWEALS